MKLRYLIPILLLFVAAGCAPSPKDERIVDNVAEMYPDYVGVTVPCNIAPLNFLLKDSCRAIYAVAESDGLEIESHRKGNEVVFDLKEWKRLMEKARGKTVKVTVSALGEEGWTKYKPFHITVSADKIDPYLTYRLIEPDYEVFSRLRIVERNIEDFSERVLCDYNNVGNRCMNCHTHSLSDGDLSSLYVRGEGGGMVLNDHGDLRLLDFKTSDMVSGPVYAQFDPTGRYLVFSTNVIIPAFHSRPDKRLEVFDTKSDVYVYDIQKDKVLRSPLLADSTKLETFPTFGPDGKAYIIAWLICRRVLLPSTVSATAFAA